MVGCGLDDDQYSVPGRVQLVALAPSLQGYSVIFLLYGNLVILGARCQGDQLDPARHEILIVVKAATYHSLSVEQGPPWRIRTPQLMSKPTPPGETTPP